jgi:hypothetical protein
MSHASFRLAGARSVNRAGNIVGYSQTRARDIHAVLWRRQ